MRATIAVIFTLFVLCGCSAEQDYITKNGLHEEGVVMNTSSPLTLRESRVKAFEESGETLLSKRDFLRIVSENETFLGVKLADFNDIDVEDFIDECLISEVRLYEWYISGIMNFKPIYDAYILSLPSRRVAPYKPREVVTEYSTDEEYGLFKERLFGKIGAEVSPWTCIRGRTMMEEGLTEKYSYENEKGETVSFALGRTIHIESLRLRGWEFHENRVVNVYILRNEFFTPIFFNRDGKFFMLHYEDCEHLVKTFVEMDG
jgi:hypothetical protein